MSKDQAFGVIILIICLTAAFGYIAIVAAPQAVKYVIPWIPWSPVEIQFGAIAAVVLVAFLAIAFIGAWIGFTMATTPPPKPIEELEARSSETSESEKQKL